MKAALEQPANPAPKGSVSELLESAGLIYYPTPRPECGLDRVWHSGQANRL